MPNVLIVEDDKTLQDVYKFIVSHGGYKVKVAGNGQEALDSLKSFSPDLILLDLMMPIKSGLDFLEEADIPKHLPKTRVVVLSNLNEPQVVRRALKLGASEHVVKSNISPKMLMTTVNKYSKNQ